MPGRILAGVRRERPEYEPGAALSLIVAEIPPDPELSPQTIEHNADDVAAAMAMFSGSSFDHPIELIDLGGEQATMFLLTRHYPDSIDQTHIFVTRNRPLTRLFVLIFP